MIQVGQIWEFTPSQHKNRRRIDRMFGDQIVHSPSGGGPGWYGTIQESASTFLAAHRLAIDVTQPLETKQRDTCGWDG